MKDPEDSRGSAENQEVRQRIRAALENGVRRMNLDNSRAETRRSTRTAEARRSVDTRSVDARRNYTSTLRKLDRLQRVSSCEINHIKIFVKLQESRKDSIFNKYEGIIIFPMDNLIKTFTKINFIFYSKSDVSMDGYYCFHMN